MDAPVQSFLVGMRLYWLNISCYLQSFGMVGRADSSTQVRLQLMDKGGGLRWDEVLCVCWAV